MSNPPGAWTYDHALAWLYDRQRLGIKLGLGKVEALLRAVGDPHRGYRIVHVAGTNGKGSVVRMMAETLRHAGLRVGLTTSPHLVSFTERVEIDGTPILREDVCRLLATLRPHVDALDTQDEPPTFFEIVTALAFLHFKTSHVEWAVVETGMGGRLDATNVVQPELTIITNVDLDHTAMLGPTVMDIAFEKAGIMKPGVPCVTGAAGTALDVLKGRSHEVQCPMSIVGDDYRIVPDPDNLVLLRPTGHAMLKVGLEGSHQKRNAALVVAGIDALRKRGFSIPERALVEGLRLATNPGRLEHIPLQVPGGKAIEILLDGAHNPAAAHALRVHLGRTNWTDFHLVAGFCADKDWQECIDQWAPLAEKVWTVPVRNPRSLDAATSRDYLRPTGIVAESAADARTALAHAAAAGAERILVAGSLFLVGEVRAYLTGQSLEEIRGAQ